MIRKSMVVFLLLVAMIFNLSGMSKPASGKAPLITNSYFVDDTGSGSSCSQTVPCLLATALSKSDTFFNIFFAAGTYAGTGDEVIYIDSYKVINLYGGWNGTTAYPPVRDPDTYVSIIDGGGVRRGIKVEFKDSPDVLAPVITGLSITGGNGGVLAGLDCNISNFDGCGGGIFIKQAAPEISYNKIYGNVADSQTIVSKQGHGGGIFSMYSPGAKIHDNQIYSNTADPQHQGNGGGIGLAYSSVETEFYNNDVYDNTSGVSPQYTWGAGLSLNNDNSQIYDNYFHGNGELGAGLISGSAIYSWYSSPTIRGNRITGNYGNDAVYLGYMLDGEFAQNRIWANNSPWGLYIKNTQRVDIENCGLTEYTTLINNFIEGGSGGGIYLSGYVDNPLCARLWHNTVDGGTTGVYLVGPSTVDMFNNAITNHSGAAIDIEVGATTPTVYHTLFYQNGSNDYPGNNPVYGDPQYINLTNGNYHIWCTSAARDAGTPLALVTNDIDGQQRPVFSGVDIGADECTPLFYLPLLTRN
jgi:Right handed beta helix region